MPAASQPSPNKTSDDCEVAARRQPYGAPAARRARLSAWAACAVWLCAASPTHAAPDLARPPLPMIALPSVSQQLPVARVQSIFHIAKSENRNQVHYGAHVDEACRPIGAAPIYAYWRMFERSPTRTEALLDREQPGYGPTGVSPHKPRRSSTRSTPSLARPPHPHRVVPHQHRLRRSSAARHPTSTSRNTIDLHRHRLSILDQLRPGPRPEPQRRAHAPRKTTPLSAGLSVPFRALQQDQWVLPHPEQSRDANRRLEPVRQIVNAAMHLLRVDQARPLSRRKL